MLEEFETKCSGVNSEIMDFGVKSQFLTYFFKKVVTNDQIYFSNEFQYRSQIILQLYKPVRGVLSQLQPSYLRNSVFLP